MRRSSGAGFGSITARPPLVMAGQTIGLLGGSFNPAHAAHVLISDTARKRLGLDAVWWIVSPGNPLKTNHDLAPLAERVAAARELIGARPIRVTTFERELPSRFTVDTISFLRRRYPGVRFVWLMGADCLAEFHRWRQWRDIFEALPIAVVDRPGWRLPALGSNAALAYGRRRIPEAEAPRLAGMLPPAWVFLTGPLSPLASRTIRARRSQGVAQSAQS